MPRKPLSLERLVVPAALAAVMALAGCERGAEEKRAGAAAPTLVTVTQPKVGALEVLETTLGSLESVQDPKVAAEVAGRVVRVHARTGNPVEKGQLLAELDPTDEQIQARAEDAEVQRLATLLAQQERVVQRQEQLVTRNFISRNALDDAIAQRNALREQIAAASARADARRRNIGKTRVVSPLDGFVEAQIAAVGDYVKVGDPLFQLVSNRKLRAHLPFPEAVAASLSIGLPVRITSPQAGGKVLQGFIGDIRPNVAAGSRAVVAIADFDHDGDLRGGGSVDAAVVIGRKNDALLVPEQSIVLRPAGQVVYVIAEGTARQRKVRTGGRTGGMVEIASGLAPNETIAVDGAGFLSDGAAVAVPRTK